MKYRFVFYVERFEGVGVGIVALESPDESYSRNDKCHMRVSGMGMGFVELNGAYDTIPSGGIKMGTPPVSSIFHFDTDASAEKALARYFNSIIAYIGVVFSAEATLGSIEVDGKTCTEISFEYTAPVCDMQSFDNVVAQVMHMRYSAPSPITDLYSMSTHNAQRSPRFGEVSSHTS